MSPSQEALSEDVDLVDLTDFDDHLEGIYQNTLLQNTRKKRHRSLSTLHLSFRPRTISEHWCRVDAAHNIKVGDAVLMRYGYVQVREILSNSASPGIIVLRGVRLRPASEVYPCLNADANEVMLVQDLYKDSRRYNSTHFLENFTYEDVQQPLIVKNVVFTNRLRTPRGEPQSHEPSNHLLCRLKYVSIFNCPSTKKKKPEQQFCPRLSEGEADPDCRVPERLLRQQGAIGRDTGHIGPVAFDGCCGAGYASLAAKAAGMSVVKAFDHNYEALQTYHTNHPEVCALHMEFSDFMNVCGTWLRPEILILSPPCQLFSPAHTVPGRNDDSNEATSFGMMDLVARLRPRVVIIENTFGLNFRKWTQHVSLFASGLLDLNYSVRKAVLNLSGLGEASGRKRFILIAAAPGEVLPDFPAQEFNTGFGHTADPSLLPTTSVWDRLQLVVANHPDHQPYLRNFRDTLPHWDPRTTKMSTITCGKGTGKTSYHWSGRRDWTPHELCVLQGAPPSFRFHSSLSLTAKRRQAGNAFTCLAAEGIFRKVVESLRKTDEADAQMNAREAAGVPGSTAERPICI